MRLFINYISYKPIKSDGKLGNYRRHLPPAEDHKTRKQKRKKSKQLAGCAGKS